MKAKASFPKIPTLARQMARARSQVAAPYPAPITIADIEIPHELQITKSGDPFLFYDSGNADP